MLLVKLSSIRLKLTIAPLSPIRGLLHLFHSSPSPPPPPITAYLRCFFSDPPPTLHSLLQCHALIVTSGNSNNAFFSSKLICLYSSFGQPPSVGRHVFDVAAAADPRDTFLWNSLIKSYFSSGFYEESIDLYHEMRCSGAPVSHFTVPMVVSASAELCNIEIGRKIQGVAVKCNLFMGSLAVGSSYIHLYSRCGLMVDARVIFEEMPMKDVVAWTTLIIGYVSNNDSKEALVCLGEIFKSVEDGRRPNFRTIEGGLQACGNFEALAEGKVLHSYSIKTGIQCCEHIKSSLLSMYSKCDSAEEAHLVFLELHCRDVVSWTSVIGAYARKGCISTCLELFQAMLTQAIVPDGILVSCLLMAAGNFTTIEEGKAFHGFVLRKGFESDPLVGNSLLSMYCKFECLIMFENVFNGMLTRETETWNFMVFGYGKMGLLNKCLDLFRNVQFLGMKSDLTSFVTAMSACSKLRALNLGRSIHCLTVKQDLDKETSVGNSLLAMYGNCKSFHAVNQVFKRMIRDVVSWNTLIAAYTHYGLQSEALALYDQMLLEDVKPNATTFSVVLSACSDQLSLDYGQQIHNHIKEAGLECDITVGTALMNMYAKCGQLNMSREIFNLLPEKDVISWNVMIACYGFHGKAQNAVESFREMEDNGLKPNEITFLAALSACSHGGLVEEGRYLFHRMRDHYCIIPTLKHHACMVDLLGRSGNLVEAESLINEMPTSPDGAIWGSLLNACCLHKNVEMGERAAKWAFEMDPENDGYYILMSNLYHSVGRWEKAKRMRIMMKECGLRKSSGWSAT